MKKINVFITGASKGIGLAIAESILDCAEKVLISSRKKASIEKAEIYLRGKGKCKIHSTHIDHSDALLAARHLGRWVNTKVKMLDLLVLNAGNYTEGSIEKISAKDFEETFQVNFFVNHYLIQKLLPIIRKSNLKRIVIIGSTAGTTPYPLVPTYGVAKWALRGYAKNLREELAKDNVGVTLISLGSTLTDMWKGEDIPDDRFLLPNDIAKLIQSVVSLSPQAVVEEIIIQPMLGNLK